MMEIMTHKSSFPAFKWVTLSPYLHPFFFCLSDTFFLSFFSLPHLLAHSRSLLTFYHSLFHTHPLTSLHTHTNTLSLYFPLISLFISRYNPSAIADFKKRLVLKVPDKDLDKTIMKLIKKYVFRRQNFRYASFWFSIISDNQLFCCLFLEWSHNTSWLQSITILLHFCSLIF